MAYYNPFLFMVWLQIEHTGLLSVGINFLVERSVSQHSSLTSLISQVRPILRICMLPMLTQHYYNIRTISTYIIIISSSFYIKFSMTVEQHRGLKKAYSIYCCQILKIELSHKVKRTIPTRLLCDQAYQVSANV